MLTAWMATLVGEFGSVIVAVVAELPGHFASGVQMLVGLTALVVSCGGGQDQVASAAEGEHRARLWR
jgi:hypothetical protein